MTKQWTYTKNEDDITQNMKTTLTTLPPKKKTTHKISVHQRPQVSILCLHARELDRNRSTFFPTRARDDVQRQSFTSKGDGRRVVEEAEAAHLFDIAEPRRVERRV